MNENGGGSQGGKDVSLDDLFGENLGANARRSAEAEGDHNKAELMGRVTCSDDEEAEVEVEKTCEGDILVRRGSPQKADSNTHRLCVRF